MSPSEYPGRLATMNSVSRSNATGSRHFARSRNASIPMIKNNRSLRFNPGPNPAHRVDRVGHAVLSQCLRRLQKRRHQSFFARRRHCHHGITMNKRRKCLATLVGRSAGRDEQNLLDAVFPLRGFGHGEMSTMDRIESAAEQGYVHSEESVSRRRWRLSSAKDSTGICCVARTFLSALFVWALSRTSRFAKVEAAQQCN